MEKKPLNYILLPNNITLKDMHEIVRMNKNKSTGFTIKEESGKYTKIIMENV